MIPINKSLHTKVTSVKNYGNTTYDKMNSEFQSIIDILLEKKLEQSEIGNIIAKLIAYLAAYDRIVYSVISNSIYYADEYKEDDKIENLNVNLSELLDYTACASYAEKKCKETDKTIRLYYEKLPSILIKLLDHISLAATQYEMLKYSDEQYKKQFEKNFQDSKDNITKEMSNQLITLVGIFTAVSFVVFGGITSLDDVFENAMKGFSILRVMMIGIIWGLCMIDLLYVFLFCVGKITKLSIKSSDKPNDNLVQKYPIIWWSNFLLIAILVLLGWMYYLYHNDLLEWFLQISIEHPKFVSVAGTIIIFLVFIGAGCLLVKLRKKK